MQPPSLDGTLLNDAIEIIETAKERGVVLRLLGAVAITLRSSQFADLHRRLKRLGDKERSFTDLDLIGYSKQRVRIRQVMEDDLGYLVDQNVLLFHGKERLVYHDAQCRYQVDVFLDGLRFSHDILFGSDPESGRLLVDYPTISPADLLLEKLQIHSISEKDLKDAIVLLRAHTLNDTNATASINLKHVASTLADDWGFWKDFTANLKDVIVYASRYLSEEMLTEADFADVSDKANRILAAVDSEPKTLKWKLRERTGGTKPWWREVEEVSR